ncbi:MAG: TauD/TfdA family dioxygenase [Porticoccaceae bacterium]
MEALSGSKTIQTTADSVIISRAGGTDIMLPNLWLRDNCPCDDCRVVETQEKRFILSTVDADIAPKEVSLDSHQLSIVWPDNHRTQLPLSIIDQLLIPEPNHSQPWPASFIPQSFDWSLFLTDNQTTVAALTQFMRHGAIVLRDTPTQSESLELLAPVLGPIREVLFDRIHNVSVTGHVYNIAHTSLGLPPHNDFASYSFPPSVQALHMLQNETPGGESIVVDGWAILEQLRLDHPEYFEILCEFPVPFREFDDNNETYAVEPMVRCDTDGNIQSLRFSNQLMQMMNPMQQGIVQFYRAYRELCVRIMHRDSDARATFRLEGGQLLLVAAHRVLHARESFQPVGARHLQDAYFELDNVANKLRQLQAMHRDAQNAR